MELEQALPIAGGIVELLSAHCELINVAGSCRRSKPYVKDIEIVCLPKVKIYKNVFGEDMMSKRTTGYVEQVGLLGEPVKGSAADGRYMQIELKEGIMLDLFMPERNDYYRQFAIRTGSADYSARILATGWRKLGWCGSDVGLRRVNDCVETSKGKSKWKCVNENATRPPAWQSEYEFFEWLKVKWIEPSLRNI